MASQIVSFPPALFDALYRYRGGLAIRLGMLEFNVTSHEDAGHRSIRIGGYSDPHGIGPRSATRDCRLALVLTVEGSTPMHWPQPLPDEITTRLLDTIEPALVTLDGITGHQSLALSAAFDEARNAPRIEPRPVAALPLRSARQRHLRRLGLELSSRFHDALGALERKRTAYEAGLMASDLERVVASLSCYAELGSRLRLRPGELHGDSRAGLLVESRRGSLADSMASAAAMSDAMIFGLERFDPYAECFRDLTDVDSIAQVNACVCGVPFRPCDDGRLHGGSEQSTVDRRPVGSSSVPSAAIRERLGR